MGAFARPPQLAHAAIAALLERRASHATFLWLSAAGEDVVDSVHSPAKGAPAEPNSARTALCGRPASSGFQPTRPTLSQWGAGDLAVQKGLPTRPSGSEHGIARQPSRCWQGDRMSAAARKRRQNARDAESYLSAILGQPLPLEPAEAGLSPFFVKDKHPVLESRRPDPGQLVEPASREAIAGRGPRDCLQGHVEGGGCDLVNVLTGCPTSVGRAPPAHCACHAPSAESRLSERRLWGESGLWPLGL